MLADGVERFHHRLDAFDVDFIFDFSVAFECRSDDGARNKARVICQSFAFCTRSEQNRLIFCGLVDFFEDASFDGHARATARDDDGIGASSVQDVFRRIGC